MHLEWMVSFNLRKAPSVIRLRANFNLEKLMNITLFYKHVTVLDYAYLDHHSGVVGDSLVVNVEFIGKTDEEGILYDFSYAKKKVKEIIDRDCDHRLVIPKGVATYENGKAHFEFPFGLNDEKIKYETPEEGLCEIPSYHVSKANLKTYLESIILKEMPENVLSVSLELEDEKLEPGKMKFHYTHGLKDHYGNCQRLFHGHSNTVDVKINGDTRPEFEEMLAKDLFKGNTHFCFWENVENKDEIIKAVGQVPYGQVEEGPDVILSYKSSQGLFRGSLPIRHVFFLEDESTVENLSINFAKIVKSQVTDGERVEVRAYEGIGKGSKTSL